MSPGPLAQAHAHLEGLTQCTQCHAPGVGVVPERCLVCHERVGEQVESGKGFHANKGERCATCHADHRGRNHPLARFELSAAEHLRETGFLLDGAHERIGCHRTPHGETQRLKQAPCDQCHTTFSWAVRTVRASVFDHTRRAQTAYVLEGAHVDVGCLECHVDALFVPLDFGTCTDCHADPHLGRFQGTCEDCHTVRSWTVGGFDHASTGFPLQGLHSRVPCEGCHGSSIQQSIPHDTCSDCHKDIHRGQFAPRPCDTCHTVTQLDFQIEDYDHAQTQFPLLGQHPQQQLLPRQRPAARHPDRRRRLARLRGVPLVRF